MLSTIIVFRFTFFSLKVEYDLFPLYWSWDHSSVEKALIYCKFIAFYRNQKIAVFFSNLKSVKRSRLVGMG